MVVHNEEGFTRVARRPKPQGTMISELPVMRAKGNQSERRADRNRFAPLLCSGYSAGPETCDCDDDECEPPHGIVDSDSEDADFPDVAVAIARQKSQRKWRMHCKRQQPADTQPDEHPGVHETKGKERSQGLRRGDEELDGIIKEFEELDSKRAAAHTVEGVKTDGQGADSTQDMSPTTTELRRQLLDRVMTADQKELARTLGVLTQAEEYDAQHSLSVTMDGECGEEVLI